MSSCLCAHIRGVAQRQRKESAHRLGGLGIGIELGAGAGVFPGQNCLLAPNKTCPPENEGGVATGVDDREVACTGQPPLPRMIVKLTRGSRHHKVLLETLEHVETVISAQVSVHDCYNNEYVELLGILFQGSFEEHAI